MREAAVCESWLDRLEEALQSTDEAALSSLLSETVTWRDLLATDIKPEELARVQEYMVKNFTEGKEKNGNWLGALNTWHRTGIDTFNDNIATINSITVDDVKAFARQMLDKGSYIVVTLDPAE